MSNVGIAAHIYAASPGGPRYNKDMSRQERRAIGNGLWLCSICAAKIDRNLEAFSATLLLEWKAAAEAHASKEQGQRLPDRSDAVDQLVMAMTGAPKKFIPGAIANTHLAAATALEALDPRFRVKSQFIEGASHFELRAREDVKFKARIASEMLPVWKERMARAFEQGEVAELPMKGVTFLGSKLLQAITEEGAGSGRITLTPPNRPAVFKLTAHGSGCVGSSDDFHGVLYRGGSTLRFQADGYRGLLKIELRITTEKNGEVNCSLSVLPNFDVWSGHEVRTLPYFERLEILFESMIDETSTLQFALEVDGLVALSGQKMEVSEPEAIHAWLNYLAYLSRTKALAKYVGTAIYVSRSREFTTEDHVALADAVDTFEGKRHYVREDIKSEPGITCIPSDDGAQIDALRRLNAYDEVLVVQPAESLRIFDVEVQLPPREIRLYCVRPRVIERKVTKEGCEYTIKWEMGPDFRCVYKFVAPPLPESL